MVSREGLLASPKLGKALRPAQKIIVFGGLITVILFFVYSFIFMTPFSDIYQFDGELYFNRIYKFGLTKEMFEGLVDKGNVSPYVYYLRKGDIAGLNLGWFTYFTRHELQTFNHWIFIVGLFGLIAALIPLIYGSQKRKIYYKTNLIVNPIVGCFNLYMGIHFLVQLIMNQMLVWSQNYTVINAYSTFINNNNAKSIVYTYSAADSNAIFIIGYVIAFALIVFGVGYILLTFLKYQHQKRQPKVDLDKVTIHE